MSHEITVNGVDADIELDDSLVWDLVSDAVEDAARDAVRDYAWDEVAYNVEEMIDSHGRSSDGVENVVVELLNDYTSMKRQGREACNTGQAFEDAVQWAANKRSVDEDLSVQKRLADLEHKMNTVLDALFVLGNRAAGVDNRADG